MEGTNTKPGGAIESEPRAFEYSRSLCWEGCRRIRVIELLPSEPSFGLHMNLIECDIDRNYEFHAISYCWGGQKPTIPVTCNGGALLITDNLASALSTLSKDIDGSVKMWADAICINQSDNNEKNIQVGLMRDIYRLASKVHVWLGLDAPQGNVKRTFDLLNLVYDSRDSRGLEYEWGKELHPVLLQVYNIFNYKHLLSVEMQQFTVEICKWRGQELFGAFSHLASFPIHHREALATDPRDKVFAILGLVSGGEDFGVHADYNMNLVDVYVNTAAAIMRNSDYLDILSVPRPSKSNSTLPSWAPDWEATIPESAILRELLARTVNEIQASGSTNSSGTICIQGSILTVQAYKVDEIEEITVAGSSGNTWQLPGCARLHMMLSSHAEALWKRVAHCKSGKPCPDGRDSFEVFLHTLHGDAHKRKRFQYIRTLTWLARIVNVWSLLLLISGVDYFPLFYAGLVWLVSMFLGLLDSPWIELFSPVEIGYSENSHLARTKTKYFALVPHMVEVGDAVMLVKGSRVPLIFRKKGVTSWELIGAAHVPGLMKGERWDEVKCESIHIE
ncbi:uncharacterized protein PAC_12605 [Phialocephala subalpina]|uniref:Heterokaryon incompatibility domain-containing protein n=1 Tax=Phialocephala subalpina TaxID=576137 RepID=A0A1L7XCG7_9HELO|nr:uncharacterized protein PAC_12605 [Phialocephala subalpina]